MKWLDDYRMKLVVVVFLATFFIGDGSANADFTFGQPVNVGPPVNSSYDDGGSISPDGLTLVMDSDRPGGQGNWDIWVSTRETTDDQWGEWVNLGPGINSPFEDGLPQISPDGRELYFYSKRPGGHGKMDVWVARRPTVSDPWGPATNAGSPINSSAHDGGVTMTADGLELFFYRSYGGAGGFDIWTTTRATRDDPWDPPVKLGPPVNSLAGELCPHVSRDGLILFFSHHWLGPIRPGGYGGTDTWFTTRPTRDHPWGPPMNPGPPLNTAYSEGTPSMLANGSMLYFGSRRPGGFGSYDQWQAPIIPVVDFNGDLKVDIDDLLILIEHWGQNEPAYDMGPMPWGDGVIDEADLEVLMRYWGQEVYDPHLLVHWKLDETEGDVAYDSAGENDAVVMGAAVWLPEGGQIDGALALDGIDDYINTLFELNPADGPFSVFAWIKGGAPGQVILSQQNGVNWLQVDVDSTLMTELRNSGQRRPSSLHSETVITDDNWHRIGFVWDGSQRILYVDDIPVALDNQSSLDGATGSLIIGTGTENQNGTFWSGLVDDVRIYDRVVTP